jgi:hypothetical protein
LERYVLPRRGAFRLGRLPAEEIEQWLNDEVDAGIAPSSVHRHYRTLRRMLAVAVDKQKIHPDQRFTGPLDKRRVAAVVTGRRRRKPSARRWSY